MGNTEVSTLRMILGEIIFSAIYLVYRFKYTFTTTDYLGAPISSQNITYHDILNLSANGGNEIQTRNFNQ